MAVHFYTDEEIQQDVLVSRKPMLMIVKRCPAESEHHMFSIQIRTSQQPSSFSSSYRGHILNPGAGDHGPRWEMSSYKGQSRSCQFGGIPLVPGCR